MESGEGHIFFSSQNGEGQKKLRALKGEGQKKDVPILNLTLTDFVTILTTCDQFNILKMSIV